MRIELDEIAIGRAVADDDLPHRRDGRRGTGVVDAIEHRQIDAREFEAKEPPAALQHPIGFRKRLLDARHIADAESDRVGVEPPIRQRQCLSIGFNKGHPVVEAASPRALGADAQHIRVMSATVTLVSGPPARATLKATSPVPPATSRWAKGREALGSKTGVFCALVEMKD